MCRDQCPDCPQVFDRRFECDPFEFVECSRIRVAHEDGMHALCREQDCDWQTTVGRRVRLAAIDGANGHPLVVVVIDRQGKITEVRPFDRAQQAKPYRTRMGRKVSQAIPKAFSFVLCDEGHFI